MPFTPSHVMAVLPGLRWRRALRVDAVALAVGSMAPDFQYFLNGRLRGELSHSLLGVAVFCVPLTLVVTALWYLRVGPMLGSIAPAAIARRGLVTRGTQFWRSPGAAVAAVASATVGALTHLVWDSATHWSGWIVHRYAVLREDMPVPWFGHLPVHRVIQHVSSIVGLLVVMVATAVAIARRPAAAEVPPRLRLARTIFAFNVVGGIATGLARLRIAYPHEWGAPDSMVVAVISGALLGTLVTSVVARPRS